MILTMKLHFNYKNTTMKNIDFKQFKNESIANSILRIPATFDDFEFLDPKHLKYKKRLFKVSFQALKDLSKVLGMASNSFKSINQKLGKQVSIAIFNNMLKAHAKKSNSDILFVIDRKGTILRILDKKSSVISNEVFFDIADRIIDQNSLEIHDLSVNSEGELIIQTRGRNSEFQINGFKDEVFESGLSISNTHFGVNVDPFVHRLVCTNGMVTKSFDESISINSINQREMGIFFDKLHRLEMNDFQSSGFSKKVTEAINTPASIDELTKAIKLLTDNSDITNHEVEEFINHKQTFRDYLNVGVDLEKISVAKKRNAKSGTSIWNVINGITNFASHNYGYNVKNNVELQIQAGNMLCKTYDISNTLDISPY